MQIEETFKVSFRSADKPGALRGVVALSDSALAALGAPRAFSPKDRGVRHDVCGPVAPTWVEVPLVGGEGEISGVMYQSVQRSGPAGAFSVHRPEGEKMVGDAAQFAVHDINNLFAVIASGLRLLENQNDVDHRNAIVAKMREAIARGALLTRQLLDTERSRGDSIDGFVEGHRVAELTATLDQALRPDISVRNRIAPDLWDFNADAEELYFALLNLCRNSADAMPSGGTITVAARNVGTPHFPAAGFVEILVADEGDGMPEEVLSKALNPYFTTKGQGSGTGLGLAQVQRFVLSRGGEIQLESKQGVGTTVRLLFPRVRAADQPNGIVEGEIAYMPTRDGGIFHVVNEVRAVPA
jgi:signal transduction histidine kinase